MPDNFIFSLIKSLLKSRFCDRENSAFAAFATQFLEKAERGGVEYDMISDCDDENDIKEVIRGEYEILNPCSIDDEEE